MDSQPDDVDQAVSEDDEDFVAPAPVEPEASAPASQQIFVSMPVEVKTRAELDEVLAHHHEWLESVLNPSKKIGPGRANLKGADMSGWDLTGVNLSGATLKNVKLIGAKLCRANLTAADLSGADLQGADLSGAKLKRALLTHADLRDANLSECDLAHARTDFTKFKDADAPPVEHDG
jgi:hypothetical protein